MSRDANAMTMPIDKPWPSEPGQVSTPARGADSGAFRGLPSFRRAREQVFEKYPASASTHRRGAAAFAQDEAIARGPMRILAS